MATLLEHYKSQKKVERGFRFLKKPPLIEALLMIRILSLLYAGLEHKIREQLGTSEEFFLSLVKNKTISKPTVRRVFLKFEGIDMLELGDQRFIMGERDHQTRLLKLQGKIYETVYS